MSRKFVADAWAILALLQGEEPAASKFKRILERAERGDLDLYISVINLGEIYYRIGRVKGEEEARETLGEIRSLPMTVLPATWEFVFAAAALKMRYPISYADAFAAAAAEELNAVLVTGDPELERLKGRIEIEKLERR